VVPAYRGMVVEVPLHLGAMPGGVTAEALRAALAAFYQGSEIVAVGEAGDVPDEIVLRCEHVASDAMSLYVLGNPGGYHARLIAVLDNLGKGASGAAIQSLNLMCGLPETRGLNLPEN
jgi:N-acetyl-gamma-glutamyl-phosphate reductase